jgi:hypothetical protein
MTALHPNQYDCHAARRQRWACDRCGEQPLSEEMDLYFATGLCLALTYQLGSTLIFAAEALRKIRRASSLVSSLAADCRPGFSHLGLSHEGQAACSSIDYRLTECRAK